MLVGDEGSTNSKAPETDPIDELAGRELTWNRIDENRSGVRAAGLVLPSPADDLGNLALRALDVAGGQFQVSGQHDLVVGEVRSAEPQPQRICRPPSMTLGLHVEDLGGRCMLRCRIRDRRRSFAPLRRSNPAPRQPIRSR